MPIFQWASLVVAAAGGPPPPPSTLAVDLRRAGPFWQDTARTTPATAGQLARVWDDLSGNGRHAVAPSDAERPTVNAAGGVTFGAACQMIITRSYSGGASWYVRRTRANTASDECLVQDAAVLEGNYIYESGAAVYGRANGVNVPTASTTADDVSSLVVGGADDGVGFGTGFTALDTTNVSVTNIRIGAYNAAGAYTPTGIVKAVSLAEASHSTAERLAMIAWQQAL